MENIAVTVIISVVTVTIGIFLYSRSGDINDTHELIRKITQSENEASSYRAANAQLRQELEKAVGELAALRRELQDMKQRLQLAQDQITTLNMLLAQKHNLP